MQKIYINGLQIHSNTQDLGFVVNTMKGLDYPDVREGPYDKPGEHGVVVPNEFYGGRPILVNGRVSGTTVNQHYTNRRLLSNALSISLNSLNIASPILLQFTTMDNLNLQCYCRRSRKPEFTEKSLNHSTFLIELLAEDPNLYDQSIQTSSVSTPSGGGAIYPVIYPVTYAAQTGGTIVINQSGNSYMFPVITLNGPLTSPIITNLTTGDVFQVNYSLLSGDTMVIDMANKTMLLNGNNAMQYFNLNNTWVSLLAGNNTIKLATSLSADKGNAVISFQNSYIGV